MKIGVVGFGYWGRILTSNLIELGYRDIIVAETNPINWESFGSVFHTVKDYTSLNGLCDCVFVASPSSTHYEICKFFLDSGIDVFCEKPLTLNLDQSKDLFDIAERKGARLFVDWLFLHNEGVKKLAEIFKTNGEPKSIFMNRLNYGPFRSDATALHDLASHDISILNFLFDCAPTSFTSVGYISDQKSVTKDTVCSVLKYGDCDCVIYVSWANKEKNRTCVFEYESDVFVWDDSRKEITKNGEVIFKFSDSPVKSAILSFLGNSDYSNVENQKHITLSIESIIDECQI